MNDKYDITKIKTQLENINAELNKDIHELIKDLEIQKERLDEY